MGVLSMDESCGDVEPQVRRYAIGFQDLDKTKVMVAGGKGANLGELSRIDGIRIPDGFCITTAAFQRIMRETSSIDALLDRLSLLETEDRDEIKGLSGEIRRAIEGTAIPGDIEEAISGLLSSLGEDDAYAIRSSATAEDLPTASFAGQQDTYLNVVGKKPILQHVSKCWASLFTERAVAYRLQNGFDHRKVHMAVVVQKMIFPQAAGILFTADPMTSNRKVVSIDAGFGLGEALVSGLVNADNYKVREGRIEKKISTKKLAIHALQGGGTKEEAIEPGRQDRQVLTDGQILQLERIGRKIEGHFGHPQDIEWCLADDAFHIVQSRPITTLFPVPEANDQENHVYLSTGHQQMMTDPISPLGISLFQLIAVRPMYTAGGRLFVDIATALSTPAGRGKLLETIKGHDPLIEDALATIIKRNFIKLAPDDEGTQKGIAGTLPAGIQPPIENDPEIPSALIRHNQASVEELKRDLQAKSGPDLLDFILEDTGKLRKFLFDPQSLRVFMAAIDASSWINEKMKEWLGEENAADVLSQSVPNNITSKMGLELLDVADVIRPYPEVVEYLQRLEDDDFMAALAGLEGGQETVDAIRAYLDKYGMRCAGEIDIARTRWSEQPSMLVPMILNHIKNLEPGASHRKFEQGRREASEKERELLDRLKQLPDGERKAEETRGRIGLLRNFIGYREYPKYGKVSRYFVYKQALLKEAERLVQANVIHEKEDIFDLTFAELSEVVRTNKLDYRIIGRRRDEYKLHEKLTPPRVITSDGEIIAGAYKRRNFPAGAIVGLSVSSGVVEGRARVILDMEDADLEEGDILVTAFTDPGWTPLFVSIKGLVTEVGGLMTHGAVIAREYGLPAIVGVENATRLIKDGQRIRVHGTAGYVEILQGS